MPEERSDQPTQATPSRDLLSYADLRGARTPHVASIIRDRSTALPRDDCATLRAVVLHGQRITSIAAIRGQPSRAIRRHVKRLLRRVLSPEYALVIARGDTWSHDRRGVGRACVIHGKSLRAAAAELNLPFHVVRRHFTAIRSMAEHTKEAA